jgi:hypothetical protein
MGYYDRLQAQLATQQAANSEDYMEGGLEYLEETSGWNEQMEHRRAGLENWLGSDAQLEGEGVKDYLADAEGGWREGLFYNGRPGLKRLKRQDKDLFAKAQEVDALFKQRYEAGAAGDYEKARELDAQARALINEYGLTEEAGFSLSEKYKQQMMPGRKALLSPTGMTAGEIVRDANELLDPDSQHTADFKRALTEGAIAQVDAAETSAGRAIATGERAAFRQARDLAGALGGARSFGSEMAVATRSAERFAAMRADVATQAGAGRAQIHAEAEKFYQSFSRAWAVDSLSAAQQWVDSRSFVRDSFREMQISLAGMYSNLSGVGAQVSANLSQTATNAALAMDMQAKQLAAEKKQQTMSLITSIAGLALGALTGGLGAWALGGSILAGAAVGASAGASVGKGGY